MLYTEKTSLISGAVYGVKEADIIFLGIPFDSTETIKPGSRFAPRSIRESLNSLEGYDKNSGVDMFDKFKVCDLGDVVCVPGSFKLTSKRITDTVSRIKEKNKEAFLIFLGGEHSISYPIVKTLDPDSIIQFDAHRDLRVDYLGNRFSHVTVMRRIHELGKRVVQFGVRSSSKEEEKFAEEKGIGQKLDKATGNLYITLDLDILDPLEVPGVSNPEPNGISVDKLLETFNKIDKSKLNGLDLVEVNPLFDIGNLTSLIAAKIILSVVSRL